MGVICKHRVFTAMWIPLQILFRFQHRDLMCFSTQWEYFCVGILGFQVCARLLYYNSMYGMWDRLLLDSRLHRTVYFPLGAYILMHLKFYLSSNKSPQSQVWGYIFIRCKEMTFTCSLCRHPLWVTKVLVLLPHSQTSSG